MANALVRADDSNGPGYAVIDLQGYSGGHVELAFFDVDRHAFLWPSSGRLSAWLKQPHYFSFVRADPDAAVFRLGPEVCNYLQTDSLVQITSRDGIVDHKEVVWPGVPTLDITFDDVEAVIPTHSGEATTVSDFLVPGRKPAPPRSEIRPAVEPSLESGPGEEPSPAAALEIDIGMAVIFNHLTDVLKESSQPPAIPDRQDEPPIEDPQIAKEEPKQRAIDYLRSFSPGFWLRWMVAATALIIVIAALWMASRPGPRPVTAEKTWVGPGIAPANLKNSRSPSSVLTSA